MPLLHNWPLALLRVMRGEKITAWPLPNLSSVGSHAVQPEQPYLHLSVLCTAARVRAQHFPRAALKASQGFVPQSAYIYQAFFLQEPQVCGEEVLLRLSGASFDSSVPRLVCNGHCLGKSVHCCPWQRWKLAKIGNLLFSRVVPSYFMFSTAANTDANLHTVTVEFCVLVILS